MSDNSLGTVTVDNSKFPVTAHLATSTQNEGELIVYAQADEYENDYYLFLQSEKEAIANYTIRIKQHVYVRGVPSDDTYYLYPNDTLTYNWSYTFHDENGNAFVPREGWPSPVYTAGGLLYRNEVDKSSYFPISEESGFDVSITAANNIYTAVIKPKEVNKIMCIAAQVNEQEDDYYLYHDKFLIYVLAYISSIDDLGCPYMYTEIPDWNIWYRTSDNKKITLESHESYKVTSHTYSNGLGKIAFKGNYGTQYVYIKILNQTNLTHIYFGNGFNYDGGIAGATNLKHIQLPRKEDLVDMETGVFEIGNLRTIVYNDTLPNHLILSMLFGNPGYEAMDVTLFVPTEEVEKHSISWFKVKSIDYNPEGSDKKIQLLDDHELFNASTSWGSMYNLDGIINLPSDYTGIKQYKVTPSTFGIEYGHYVVNNNALGNNDVIANVTVSLEDDEKYKGVTDKLIARITFKMP